MRDRLIELIQDSVGGCAKYWAETIADHLLAAGIVTPPCKVGETVYYIGGIHSTLIKEATVEEIYYNSDSFAIRVSTSNQTTFDLQQGEYFLTREEAEKALERREG